MRKRSCGSTTVIKYRWRLKATGFCNSGEMTLHGQSLIKHLWSESVSGFVFVHLDVPLWRFRRISNSCISLSLSPSFHPSWLPSSLCLSDNLIISTTHCLTVIDSRPAKWSLKSQEKPVICCWNLTLVPLWPNTAELHRFHFLFSLFATLSCLSTHTPNTD